MQQLSDSEMLEWNGRLRTKAYRQRDAGCQHPHPWGQLLIGFEERATKPWDEAFDRRTSASGAWYPPKSPPPPTPTPKTGGGVVWAPCQGCPHFCWASQEDPCGCVWITDKAPKETKVQMARFLARTTTDPEVKAVMADWKEKWVSPHIGPPSGGGINISQRAKIMRSG